MWSAWLCLLLDGIGGLDSLELPPGIFTLEEIMKVSFTRYRGKNDVRLHFALQEILLSLTKFIGEEILLVNLSKEPQKWNP